MEDIIAPISKELLNAELTEDKRLRMTNKSNNQIYIITAQDSPNTMKEIGRLREIAFRAAGGGTGMSMDIDEYDTIYLGYPNWWSTMPTIVMTFLESYDFTNKHIYPICSHEGSGMGRSESNLKKLCPNSIVHKGLSIHGSHVDGCRQQLERGLGEK